MPADPKPSGQRVRRNLNQAQPVKLAAGGAVVVPDPPAELSDEAVAAWASWWGSPMAAVWVPADLVALYRLARLTDVAIRGDATAAVLSEIRQLEDRFGLSPLARRRLAWELEQAGASDDVAAEPASQDDRWLRAVSG